jgi:hypothetical protein
MIATTISNSISEKPFCFFLRFIFMFFSLSWERLAPNLFVIPGGGCPVRCKTTTKPAGMG